MRARIRAVAHRVRRRLRRCRARGMAGHPKNFDQPLSWTEGVRCWGCFEWSTRNSENLESPSKKDPLHLQIHTKRQVQIHDKTWVLRTKRTGTTDWRNGYPRVSPASFQIDSELGYHNFLGKANFLGSQEVFFLRMRHFQDIF